MMPSLWFNKVKPFVRDRIIKTEDTDIDRQNTQPYNTYKHTGTNTGTGRDSQDSFLAGTGSDSHHRQTEGGRSGNMK